MLTDEMVEKLMEGRQPGLAESLVFLAALDPCGGLPEADDDEDGPLFPPLARDPRAEKLRDWRRAGRPRVKARAVEP